MTRPCTRGPHPFRWSGHGRSVVIMAAPATVALDHCAATAPKKVIGLHSPGKLVGAQGLAGGDLMGKRNRVLRRKVPAVRDQTVASAPSSRWYSIADDAPQRFGDVRLGNEFRNHDVLTLPQAAIPMPDSSSPSRHDPISTSRTTSSPSSLSARTAHSGNVRVGVCPSTTAGYRRLRGIGATRRCAWAGSPRGSGEADCKGEPGAAGNSMVRRPSCR